MSKTKNEYPPNFEKFWQAYPRKTAKPNALKAWIKLNAETDAFMPNQIIGDVEKRARLGWWNSQKFVPHPATWLNAQRWDDEGWEDDIAAAKNHRPAPVRPMPQPNVHAGPELSGWHMMLNRMARNYILKTAKGTPLTDADIKRMLKIKHEVLKEFESIADEEIRNDPATRVEMATMIVETFLSRCDIDLNRSLKYQVISEARKAA